MSVRNGVAGDGNGWVRCARGHRHWGRFGACGLLLTDAAATRVVLQHRAAGTHEGDTWAVPGGARDSNEDYVDAALREAAEEAGVPPAQVSPIGWRHVDHGGWSYTTVVARAVGAVDVRAVNWESEQVRWYPVDHVAGLPLHPGFAAAWPHLRLPARAVTLVIDARSVAAPLLARPCAHSTGTLALAQQCRTLARAGLDPGALPAGMNAAALDRLLPRIVLVAYTRDAMAGDRHSELTPGARHPRRWPDRQVEIIAVRPPGTDEALAGEVVAQARRIEAAVVVTADADLAERLPADTLVRSARWFMTVLNGARVGS